MTSLSHGLFLIFLLSSQPGHVINGSRRKEGRRAAKKRLKEEQPGKLCDLYLVFLSFKVSYLPKIICGKAPTAVLCIVPTVYRNGRTGKDVLTDLARND